MLSLHAGLWIPRTVLIIYAKVKAYVKFIVFISCQNTVQEREREQIVDVCLSVDAPEWKISLL